MVRQNYWYRIKQQTPAWVLSLVAHLLILAVLGMITWIVAEAREPDRPLLLVEQEIVTDEGDGQDGLTGSLAGAASDQTPPSRSKSVLKPATIPQPKALDLSADGLMTMVPVTERLVDHTDSTSSLVQTLADASSSAGGTGTGMFPGAGGGLGKVIGGMRKTGLDVVLVLDATDSMTPYIEQSKKRLQQVVNVITHLVPNSRFGVVAYKDYGDDYGPDAIIFLKITPNHKSVRKFIDEIIAGGGADEPEPINEAIAVAVDAKKMGWRGSRKRVIILVGDSSIHPSGRKPAFKYARQFATKLRGTINVIDVGGTGDQKARRRTVQPDLARIAKEGKGSAFLLTDREAFWRHLIISVFGQQYEHDVNTIIERFVKEK
ncbi:MAG: VWA domain-containing protein [Phycisphaerae bacterium]|nr:VWA domain-containing protein [Phycisphaerae bacterium]